MQLTVDTIKRKQPDGGHELFTIVGGKSSRTLGRNHPKRSLAVIILLWKRFRAEKIPNEAI